MVNKIKEIIEDRIILWEEKKRLKKNKTLNREKENFVYQGFISKKKFNYMHNFLPMYKNIYVEKGINYEIETPKYKDRIFFECIKSGNLIIHYISINGKDILSFGGSARMKCNENLTKGFNE